MKWLPGFTSHAHMFLFLAPSSDEVLARQFSSLSQKLGIPNFKVWIKESKSLSGIGRDSNEVALLKVQNKQKLLVNIKQTNTLPCLS